MPFELKDKKSGDVLQSQEWNAILEEIRRLETAKINREGADTFKGSLTINEALTVNGNVTIGRIQQIAKVEVFGTLKLQQGIAINEFSTDVNLSDNSDSAVPTEKAIKTYTDNRINQVNQTLTTKAALAGSATQDFQIKDLRVSGDWYWTPSKNFNLTPTSANQEWSFDLMNQATTTGCYWQVWSDKPNLGSLLVVRGDTGNVGIGTADPQRRLQIAGDVGGLSFEAGTGTPNSGVIRFGDNTGWKLHFGRSRDSSNGNLNSGTAGVLMTIQDNGNVGVGTTDPRAKLTVVGTGMISNGSNYAVTNNYMASGSLTIGSVNVSYGGGNLWNSNTAGLLFETQANTEIAVHDAANRLTSFIYYEGDNLNRITIGRDMGWGSLSTLVLNSNNINITGTLTVNSAIRAASSDIYFTDTEHNHTGFGNTTGYAAIENAKNYNALMILGRAGTDKGRCVKLWDYLEVNGNLDVVGRIKSQHIRTQAVASNKVDTTATSWVDLPNMSVTITIPANTGNSSVLILFKTGGVQTVPDKEIRGRFRLLVNNDQRAFTLHEFHNAGWELRDVTLTSLETLGAGTYTIKVQWYTEKGTLSACWFGDTRSLIVVEL